MAKIKVDTTGVETEPEAVKPGLYPAKIKEVELTESQKNNAPMLKVIFEISGGPHDGRLLFDYIMLDDESMAWKLASFQDALGLKRKGEIDTDKIVGKRVQVRTVVQKSEEYGEQARVRNILPPKGKGSPADEDLEDEGEDEDEVDYAEMSIDELVEELEAREIVVPKKKNKKAIIRLLEEDDEEQEGEDSEEADEETEDSDNEDENEDESSEDDEDEEGADYSEMDLAELKSEAKERGIAVKGKNKKTIIAALEESDEEDEDEDEDEDEEEQDYDEMDLDELKDECKERGLKATGKKAQLIKRLEADDESGDDGEPF